MSKIYIPAWHYKAPGLVQRVWGWSPIEEMVLLTLDATPGTIDDLASALHIPRQVAASTVARLMQFGLIEVRMSPRPMLSTNLVGREFIRGSRALPERSADREIGISVVYEKVGESVFRNRDVDTIPMTKLPKSGKIIAFPVGEPLETDYSMMQRVTQFMSGMLRPGEWLRGIQANSSYLERKFLVLDLNDVRDGAIPPGASEKLIEALKSTIKTGRLPVTAPPAVDEPPAISTDINADQIIVGARQQLERFEQIVKAAKSHIFILSTFVASQNDDRCKENRDGMWQALDDACRRGVKCHLFFGTSIDAPKHAAAMHELSERLSGIRRTRGYVLAHRDSVESHAKFLVADDGQGGVVVSMGSCNWLSSPFSAVEVSVELTEANAAGAAMDVLQSIIAKISSAGQSIEALQFMAAELRRNRSRLSAATAAPGSVRAAMRILHASDHNRLLRVAAHDAKTRFICCTNRVGANMVPALFDPAEVASQRLDEVSIYYSRRGGPVKRGHVSEHRDRLKGAVGIFGIPEPQLHAKFLAWDDDHIVVSSLNWGSQSATLDNPMDEIGLYLEGTGLATLLLEKFDAENTRAAKDA
ncbi:phospholipase D-like domain-containing protein (plasmid) [Rhizobium sp. CB3060]|uniref:phospholipase D-like domain-containing protein n=1 Tax=Rhizobium sp. CB3060 TaxID=3138255 RepID=UPI0021A524E4|nr:phospholipase D-like domain-containing protein [Rhizobium tropici]UWU25633.1 phospholipase D-like domain-containing protein [Rhizobium tropici]